MSCPSCGAALETGARFCGVCGHRIESEPKRPATPRPSADPRAETVPVQALLDRSGDPYVGTMLNSRFHIEAKLGEGGFGAVYRGVQQGIGRKVALKLLHPEMARDQNLVARFKREGLVMCKLRDAHTVTTYDFDQTPDGTLYIAMELLEGKSLHQVFHDEAPIDWRRMFRIVQQMCSSLAEAHAEGIVHRDLKPENIHLESRPGNPEFVKVLDFGIAKVVHGDGSYDKNAPQLTATGQTLGTLEYMSPEQLMGKPLDGRSDVYALGVLAYEMITGRLPFPDAKGPAGLITAQLRQIPDAPSKANPAAGIPPAVDRCILTMLEKDKARRFADVTELSSAIKDLLATDGQTAGPGGPQVAAGSAQLATPQPAPAPVAAPQVAPAPVSMARSARPEHAAPTTETALAAASGSRAWLWIVLAIIAIGGAVGAALALT
jgi:eukaryotic-like serine/threonine-protein kinase